MNKSAWGIWSLALLSVFICSATPALSQALRPARSVYDLKLNQDRDTGGIEAASGRLVVELVEDCSGYILNQGFITHITSSEAQEMFGNMQASVWESRDGRSMRFTVVNTINGATAEREQGRGNLHQGGAGNGSGLGVWKLPAPRELALPKGTLFPISYNRAVLRAVLAGRRSFETTLFDGTNAAGFYHASAFIGDKWSQERGKRGKLLARDLPSWPVRLAYYHQGSQIGTPQFEVGFTLYGDGVVDELKLDYPDFGLIGHLMELEYLDRPDCG